MHRCKHCGIKNAGHFGNMVRGLCPQCLRLQRTTMKQVYAVLQRITTAQTKDQCIELLQKKFDYVNKMLVTDIPDGNPHAFDRRPGKTYKSLRSVSFADIKEMYNLK